MALRLLVILALLAQPLALPVMMAGAGGVEPCVATSCCEVVETTTCCGEVVAEMRCGKTGSACLCGMEPDDSERAPEAPRPQERSELAPILVAVVGNVSDVPAAVRTGARWTPPAIGRTHNETRALLCIWRT